MGVAKLITHKLELSVIQKLELKTMTLHQITRCSSYRHCRMVFTAQKVCKVNFCSSQWSGMFLDLCINT